MITIMGATGHTGKRIVTNLLRAGEKVRALGRSEQKLAELARAGAEVRVGDAGDAAFLAEAFRGAEAVYTLIAAAPQAADFRGEQDQLGEAIVRAIRDSGVRRVVALSSLGGELPEGNGPIAGLHAQEERLKRLAGVDVLLLRPAWFCENFEQQLPLIEHQGISGDSLRPDVVMPMVATRDIAEVAAEALRARDWRGVIVRELLGARDYTPAETARIYGERIGRPELPYLHFQDADMIGALVQAGISEAFARLYVEMTGAINAGKLQPRAGRTQENTTPTRFEEFAAELAGRVRLP